MGSAGGAVVAYLVVRRLAREPTIGYTLRAGGRASRRRKKRYIVFEVLGVEPVKFEELRDAIMGTVRRVYGELGEARLRVKLIEYDEVRRRGILRVRREFKLHALAVLGLTRDFNGRRLLLVPISTTGSLKRARALVRS
jgi:ribonuclease P/MRP protein subunit POP5